MSIIENGPFDRQIIWIGFSKQWASSRQTFHTFINTNSSRNQVHVLFQFMKLDTFLNKLFNQKIRSGLKNDIE